MKRAWKSMLWVAVAILICSCRSVETLSKQPENATEQGGCIVSGIVTANYAMFAAGTKEKGNEADEENFVRSCRELEEHFGKMKSFRPIGELQTPLLINQLYAVKFSRMASDGKVVEHEQLLQLVFGRESDQIKLLGMRFL